MNIELYAAFVLASVLLIIVPGPNVSLIVANSLAHGPLTRFRPSPAPPSPCRSSLP